VKLFTPEQIAQRLDDRFKLLTGGSRTALPRQQTLRALIDWSYQSLNETEQRALRRLAVFSGGWTIEAAESVIGENEAMEGLLGLVNKSLVNVEEQEDESRYRFLETIRQYAMEKLLESGEAAPARDGQLDYMLQIADQTDNRMFGAETQEWFDQMEVEHDNLRAAFEWAISNQPEKALKLAYAVGGFWTVRDHISEARTWCQAILEKTKSMSNVDEQRARVYGVLGWMSVTSGEHKAGRAAAEHAISLGRQSNDMATVARAHGILALTSVFLGDFPTAQQAAIEGESIARRLGLKSELAFVLSVRGQLEYFSRKDLAQAKAHLDEAFHLAKEMGFRWASSFLSIGMAHTAAVAGDIETARAGFRESGEIAKKMGNKRILYSSQSELAHVLRERGELDEPLATYRDLLPKWKDLGHRSAVAHELECIAYILVRKEEPERAATLLGAAEALRTTIDSVMTKMEQAEYEREVSGVRDMLGEEFMKQWDAGRALTMDEAIGLAMKE
jgi:non-specific serine/threonine protein kinase